MKSSQSFLSNLRPVLLLAVLALAGCSSSGSGPESRTDTTLNTIPVATSPEGEAPEEAATEDSTFVGLIDVMTLQRSENIYAASAANAIAAAAQSSSTAVTWEALLEATAAIDTIEYPEIVEGLEVLEIDEVAVRVLTTNSAASGGDWGESYVCLTNSGVIASEIICTE